MNIILADVKKFIEVDILSFMAEFLDGTIKNYFYKDTTIDYIYYPNFESLPTPPGK